MRVLAKIASSLPFAFAGTALANRFHRYVLARQGDSYDVRVLASLEAGWSSAQYFATFMLKAAQFNRKHDFLLDAVRRCAIDGLYLEFGVASGSTLRTIASAVPEKIYGFDCFEGLPEDWRPGFPKGSFSQALPVVPRNAELVVGMFDDSLPKFLELQTASVAFLHIDCDLYSSTKTIFDYLGGRLVPGSIIVFDEYMNYPGWRLHEFRAFQEFARDAKVKYSYQSLVPTHQQVCIRIDEINDGGAHVRTKGASAPMVSLIAQTSAG